ncbi:MAG TPA: NAD(P)/FAD-dependent oxidoreductase [Chthoniobacteraceae bacterium]|nr:NAD(P)/FAD-dependent oxidoreductase [Chthoniobacteraceae bacterium]
MNYDVIICGGGPAGTACAAVCAVGGMKTLLIEKARFPREKVCGDCINPSCWPVLERLGVADRVIALPHSEFTEVEFIGLDGKSIRYPLHPSPRGEIAIKRSLLDQLLLQRAIECGAEVRQEMTVTGVEPGWKIRCGEEIFEGRNLVAADGRNSSVLRLLNMLPSPDRERVAIQAHIPAPPGFGERVALRFLPAGYCGYSSVGNGELNLCLVGKPGDIPALKHWAAGQFEIPPGQSWRTITPLSRKPVPPTANNLLLVGDAARVIEPYTGEGIYYAIASGELAAKCLVQNLPPENYRREHERLYSGRLWVNRVSRYAALHPRLATIALEAMRHYPPSLRFLTSKIVGTALAP